jgi:phage terminase Nu1 subunit (DNA packaging protein)
MPEIDELDAMLADTDSAMLAATKTRRAASRVARQPRKAAPAPADVLDSATPKPKRRGRPPLPADDPLKVARARAAEASAAWNELKAAKLEGELVEAAAVAARYAQIVADARARLLAVPARVGAKQPHLTVGDLVAIEREIRAALTDLADGRSHAGA